VKQEEAQTSFARRLDEHRGILFNIAAAYCRRREDRDDLVQTMALEAWRAFARFDERRSFSTWLYRIALNVAISFYRRERRHAEHLQFVDDAALDHIPVPFDGGADRTALLHALIDRLSELDRAIVVLYLDGEPHAEIADILGISQTNVATKIGRIKDRLRRFAAEAPNV
jgi:RNA polymerase sigma-70 factor, ECF subfamily